MDLRSLSEADICQKVIDPALQSAGWDLSRQVRREYGFTDGRIIVRGRMVARGKRKRADYLLFWKKNLPIAVLEAKDNNHGVGDGMQQAIAYAETLDVPFAISSNGDGFVLHDRTGQAGPVEQELTLGEFPSPEALWQRYRAFKGLDQEQTGLVEYPYYEDLSGKEPRYYQRVAINRCIEAIAKGQQRLLLVMATGTGKTYTAFQIIWRLWKAGRMKRVLFLADRNILVDQTMTNDFKPFAGAMTKIGHRKTDKSFEIHMALYQAVSGTEEEKNIYKNFSADYFDLIIVDECHRSSAAEAAAWHRILTYFDSATQIGMTATPKETKDVSNITYFGEPVYIYSLKEGIEDGFLAPYKVVRVDIDKDLQGWRPEKGMVDDLGEEIEDRVYNQRDFDRTLVLNQRTKLVASKVVELLEATNPFGKTIIFCEDIDHAERMRRAIIQANPERAKKDSKYVMKITGDDKEGKAQLDYFIHPEKTYPVIATTSKLLGTGVDTKTCELIVLDKRIGALTDFKQIIGRGSRVHEETGKLYFTILDFKKATELFADVKFDGPPEVIYEPKAGEPVVPPDDLSAPALTPEEIEKVLVAGEGLQKPEGNFDGDKKHGKRLKYRVSGVDVSVVAERVQYYGKDGKLITESLRDYTKNGVLAQYRSLDHFLKAWNEAERKQAILDELTEQGILVEALQEELGREVDPFDLICHVVFGQPPMTRRDRADNVRKRDIFTRYGEQARKVLEALLDKYADEGITPVEKIEVLKVQPFTRMGTPVELVKSFGGKESYEKAVKELESELYRQTG